MFGKIMSLSDELMYKYYELLTSGDPGGIRNDHPMEAKKKLAMLMVEKYHGSDDAQLARQHFEQVFSKKEVPDNIESFRVEHAGKLSYILVASGLCKGMNEARRQLAQGAVRIDGEKVADDVFFEPRNCVVQVGRRQFRKFTA
jgi:tyrosyl-tRNA synthetase